MPQTHAPDHALDLATEDDVLQFVESVPADLVPCRADRHPWTPQIVIAYTAKGGITKNFPQAAALDITEVCPNCGCKRHHTRSLRTRDRSAYTYSDHNPLLRAPHGVWETQISVRQELQHKHWSRWAANGGRFETDRKTGPRRSAKAA
jgi:hypothetical protein